MSLLFLFLCFTKPAGHVDGKCIQLVNPQNDEGTEVEFYAKNIPLFF